MDIFFFDNTDPEGFDRVFDRIGEGLPETLVIVVSKSGGTKDTRNGMLEAEAKFAAKGTSVCQARCRCDRCWKRVGQTRRSERMARAFPNA